MLKNTINHYKTEKYKIKIKQSKIFIRQSKSFENPNIIEIKFVTIEHPKNSRKLSEAIRQAKKVSQVCFNGFLESVIRLLLD